MYQFKKSYSYEAYYAELYAFSAEINVSMSDFLVATTCPSDCPYRNHDGCSKHHHPKTPKAPSSLDANKKLSKQEQSSSHIACSSHTTSNKIAGGSSAKPSSSVTTQEAVSAKTSSSAPSIQTRESSRNEQRVKKSTKTTDTIKKYGQLQNRQVSSHQSSTQKAGTRKAALSLSDTEKRRLSSSASKNTGQKSKAAEAPIDSEHRSRASVTGTGSSSNSCFKTSWFEPPTQEVIRQRFLAAINRERQALSLPELTLSAVLNNCAAKHNYDQAFVLNEINHIGSDGSELRDRIKRVGYSTRWYGENVAHRQKTPEWCVRSLMKSPGHRKNIVNKKAKEMGIHGGIGKDGYWYWTQVLGAGPKCVRSK